MQNCKTNWIRCLIHMTKKLQVPKVVHRNSKSPFTMSGALGYTWHTVQHMRTFPIVLAFKYCIVCSEGNCIYLAIVIMGSCSVGRHLFWLIKRLDHKDPLYPLCPHVSPSVSQKDNRLYSHTRYCLPAVVFLSLCLLRNQSTPVFSAQFLPIYPFWSP